MCISVLQAENAHLGEQLKGVALRDASADETTIATFSADFSESKLDASLQLRISFVGEDAYGTPSTGRSAWSGTYASIFALIGAKLFEEPSESDVQQHLNKVVQEAMPAYEHVGVNETDFQSLKMKLLTLGLINLTKSNNRLCWSLTTNGRALIAKLHM